LQHVAGGGGEEGPLRRRRGGKGVEDCLGPCQRGKEKKGGVCSLDKRGEGKEKGTAGHILRYIFEGGKGGGAKSLHLRGRRGEERGEKSVRGHTERGERKEKVYWRPFGLEGKKRVNP